MSSRLDHSLEWFDSSIRSRVSGVGSSLDHLVPVRHLSPLRGVVGWRPDDQRSRLSLIGQMKMEVETSGETPSTGPPGADDGGATDVAALVEGIISGSAWLTCGCCCRDVGGGGATGWVDDGMWSSVVVFVSVAPVAVHAQDLHGCHCGAASFVLLALSRFIFAQ
ncbi:hypothetical protein VPH35_053822 [Triticum aestivum]